MTGLSRSNLQYMPSFAEAWPTFDPNVPQPVGHLALSSRITETFRKRGPGFSFVGRQVHLDVDGDNFHIDLLVFHIEQLGLICTKRSPGLTPEFAVAA